MSVLIKFYILIILVLAGSFPTIGLSGDKTLLVIGDSISSGYGMAINDGWVSLLQKRLNKQGHSYTVVNASITGDTSASGKLRIKALLTTHLPEVVLIELGGNDGLRGLPIKELKANLQAMIDQSQQYHARVLLTGMQILPNYGLRYAAAFKNIYTDLSKEKQVELVPFLLEGIGGVKQMMQNDGVHPNRQAQQLILDNIWPHLEKLL